jgi:hypothetical protein
VRNKISPAKYGEAECVLVIGIGHIGAARYRKKATGSG